MVVIQVKRTDMDQFLIECSTKDSNARVIEQIAHIWNLRERIGRVTAACEDLAKHGPAKPEAERGLDEMAEREGKAPASRSPHYCADPLGNRTGEAPPPGLAETLLRTCEDAKALLRRQPGGAGGIALTEAVLQERLDNVRGAVMMAWPMGLPEYDLVQQLLHDADGAVLESLAGADYFDPATATLWCAGKEFHRDQTVGDRVGHNEKTKVIARLQPKAGGPPVREPAVSEAERSAMMAWYFKRQEQEKALAEDRDDGYLGAKWADTKALKSELLGTTSLGWSAGGRR